MTIDLDKKYYIGRSTENRWSSVYAYRPKNENIFLEKGEIFSIISLEGPRGFSAAPAGNMLLDLLHESYFESGEVSPLVCLENSVIKTAERLAQLVENDEKLAEEGIDLNIIAFTVVDKIAYFVQLGQGGLFMFREGSLVDVTQALKDPTGEGFIKSASTVYFPNDSYALLSPQAKEAYLKEELVYALDNFDSSDLEKKPLEEESLLSFIIISPEKENVELEPELSNQIEQEMATPEPQKVTSLKEKLEQNSESVETDQESQTDGLQMTEDYQDDLSIPETDDEQKNLSFVDKLKQNFENIKAKITGLEVNKKVKEKWDNLKPEGSSETTFNYVISEIKFKAGRIYRTLYKAIWLDFLQMDQGIYLRNARRGTNWRLIIVLSVLVFGVLYVFFNITSANQKRAREIEEARNTLEKAESTIEEVDPKINSILGVFDTYSRERSTYETTLSNTAESLNNLTILEEEKSKIDELKTRVEGLQNKLQRKVQVSSPDVIMDFASQIDESVNLTDMEIVGNILYVTDASKGKIYTVDYYGNSFRELTSNLQSPQSLSVNEDGELLGSDQNSSEPIFTVNTNSGSVTRLTGINAEGLGSISQIANFKFNNANRVYFTKAQGVAVQYISAIGAGYAGAFDRLDDARFNQARDLEIVDGKVYILVPGEGVLRYFGQQQEQFSIFGLNTLELQNILSATSMDVSGDFIIYGNSLGKSIIFTTKSSGDDITQSNFVAQIVIEDNDFNYLSSIKEIKVDYIAKNIFVLDGSRILRFNYSEVERLSY